MRRTNPFTLLTTFVALLLCGSLATVVVQTAPSPAGGPKAESPPDQTPQSGYLGSDNCVVCHENYDATVTPTKHGFKANERTPMAQRGCESCHGPGEAHASDPEKIKPIQFAEGLGERRPTRSARPATTEASTRCGTAASTRTATSSASTATACTRARGRR